MAWRCVEAGSAKEQENEGVITGEKWQLRAAPAIDDGGARARCCSNGGLLQ
jgi:hypothetical protein